ncbi:MAG TPA: SDR family oxidoreductase [Novosphingobium sp.]|nr:SDR family oxidoreductase [Novosphingobium sp.]
MEITRETVAVITGGASGMGRATALAMARRGASVVIADLNAERIADTVAELNSVGVGALGVRCDVGNPDDIQHLRDKTIEQFGHVDILMNNAGVLPIGDIDKTPLSEFDRTMRINFMAVVCGVQTFLPDLAARGQAHIINTSSLAATFAYDPATIAYNASKAAVFSFTESLALAVAAKGIGVTCLIPGPVATNIMEQVTVSGELRGMPGAYASEHFPLRTAEEVGELVAEAVSNNTFFLPTNDGVTSLLARHAAEPDAFLREIQAWLAG